MPDPTTAERIVHAARALLERDGAQAVSMRRVADTVGITPMAIYRHFPDREALLQRISDDSFAEIAQQWAAFPRKGTPLARLLAVHRNYLDYALAHPHLFDYVFSHAHAGTRRFPEDMRGQRSPTLNVVADLVQVAMDEGFLARDDVWEVVMCLWAHSHGLIALYRAGRFSYDAAEFRHFHDASLRRLIDGLKA